MNRRRQPFQGLLPNWRSGLKSADVIDRKRVVRLEIQDGLGPFGLFSALRCSSIVRALRTSSRMPAWEDDSKLETKNIAFPCTSFWRLRIPRFHAVLPSPRKRSTRMGKSSPSESSVSDCRVDKRSIGELETESRPSRQSPGLTLPRMSHLTRLADEAAI